MTKIIKTYTDRRLYCLRKEKDSRFSLLPKISMILYINTGRMRFAIYLSILIIAILRSSPSKVFLGKGVQKICSNFTGEHPVPKLLCNFIEIALRHVCSLVNLLHIFRILFLKNTSEGLLLNTTQWILSKQEQEQPPGLSCKKRCSYKLRKIHRKKTIPESLC